MTGPVWRVLSVIGKNRGLAFRRQREQLDHRLCCRADGHGVQYGSDPDLTSEQPADRDHAHFDDGAGGAHRVAACGESEHQPVPGPGPEAGADVEPGRGGIEQYRRTEDRAAQHQRARRRKGVRRDRGDRAHEYHVADRADPRPHLERYPCRQDQCADQVDDHADGKSRAT